MLPLIEILSMIRHMLAMCDFLQIMSKFLHLLPYITRMLDVSFIIIHSFPVMLISFS
jgi:hypothetical protein